jgi:hypothetical protein
MGIRHQAIKATLDAGTSAEWNDDHISDFTTNIEDHIIVLGPALNLTWDMGQNVNAGAADWQLVSGHAFVELDTPANTNDISSIRKELDAAVANITHPDDIPVLTAGVQIAQVHDAAGVANSVVEFGFQDDSDALFTQNQHHALFRVYNGKVHAVTGDGAAETETEIADYNEYGHYRISLSATRCDFYVDNMETAAASHTANLPDADLTVKFSVRSKNNVASTIRIDGCGLVRLRKV